MTLAQPGVRRYAGLWLLALLLPVMASAAAVFVNVDPAMWWSMPASMKRGLTGDALLFIAGAIVLAAPVAGVVVAASGRAGRERDGASGALPAAWPLTAAVAIFVGASAMLTVIWWGLSDADALRFVATSHATLFAVTLALSAFGALCGATFTDALDAVGCSLTIVLVAAGGLLVAGAALADVPRALIDVALTASPFVTMASASHIDVMRMGVPYQMSPLAHLQVAYPSWYVASGWYLALAGLCFLGVRWKTRSWQSTTVN